MSIYDSLLTPPQPQTGTPAPQPQAPSYGIYDSLLPPQPTKVQTLKTQADQAQSQADYAGSPAGLISNTIGGAVNTIAKGTQDFLGYTALGQLPGQIYSDINRGVQITNQPATSINQQATNFVGGAGFALGKASGDVLAAVFTPISTAIGMALKASGAQTLMDSAGQIIADKSGVTDWPAFQKFATEHPNAGEDFGSFLNLALMAIGGEKAAEMSKIDAKAFAEKIIPPEANRPTAETPAVPIKGEIPKASEPISYQGVKPSETPKLAEAPKPETAPLAQEAQKYKSAEEFVRAQGEIVYRGGLKAKGDISVTTAKDVAEFHLRKRGSGTVEESIISPNAKILNEYNIPENILRNAGDDFESIISYGRKNGYDVVDLRNINKKSLLVENKGGFPSFKTMGESELRVLNPDVLKTKSQLTDFYNKVRGPIEPPKPVEPSTGTTPSGLGKSIEAKAVEANLTKKFENVAGYDASTIKEQAQIFTDLVNEKGIDEARAVLRGEKPLPEGGKSFPFIVNMEAYLKEHPNPDLAYELANSPHTSASSEAASQLGLGQNREQDSFTAKVQEVRKAREDALAARGGGKVKQDVVAKIKDSVRKTNTKENWGDFVKSLEC